MQLKSFYGLAATGLLLSGCSNSSGVTPNSITDGSIPTDKRAVHGYSQRSRRG